MTRHSSADYTCIILYAKPYIVYVEILDPYDTAEPTLLERILSHQLKPVFQKNPHPAVNTATGRRLARPAGGTDAVLDYYEGQDWKRHPGMLNVLSWCVRHTEVRCVVCMCTAVYA